MLSSSFSRYISKRFQTKPRLFGNVSVCGQRLGNSIRHTFVSASTDGNTGTRSQQAPKQKFNVRPITKGDVEFSFARASGPGGQNVNKTSTKVVMHWDLNKANWVPEEVRESIRRLEKNRLTKEGILVVMSTQHRTQHQNFDEALIKLQDIIKASVEELTPKEIDPDTVKKVQASIKAGQERRLQEKKKESVRKKERGRKDWD